MPIIYENTPCPNTNKKMKTIVCLCFSITTLLFLVETTLTVGVYERIILLPTTVTFTFAAFCTDKSTVADRTHVAIKNGRNKLSKNYNYIKIFHVRYDTIKYI